MCQAENIFPFLFRKYKLSHQHWNSMLLLYDQTCTSTLGLQKNRISSGGSYIPWASWLIRPLTCKELDISHSQTQEISYGAKVDRMGNARNYLCFFVIQSLMKTGLSFHFLHVLNTSCSLSFPFSRWRRGQQWAALQCRSNRPFGRAWSQSRQGSGWLHGCHEG